MIEKPWYKKWWGILFIIFALGALANIANQQSPNTSTTVEKAKKTDNSIMAWAMSHEFVRPMLKSPSTAKFGPFEESSVTHMGDEKYRIVAYVDSQNSFGAMLRTYYTCELKYKTDTEKWQMLDVKFQK